MDFSLKSVKFAQQIRIHFKRRIHVNNISFKDYYESLEVTQTATQGEIKNSYYRLSKLYHPDIAINDEKNLQKFREITVAYDVLGNIKSRKLYDKGAFIKGKLSDSFDINRTATKKTDASKQVNVYEYGRDFRADTWVQEETSKQFFEQQIVKRKYVAAQDDMVRKIEADGAFVFFGVLFAVFIIPYFIYRMYEDMR